MEWNAGFVDNLDMNLYQAGVSYNFTDKFRAFALGEYMYHKSGDVNPDAGLFYKSRGWASYLGLSTELGWRHEDFRFKDKTGDTHTKAKLDTVYGQLTFLF